MDSFSRRFKFLRENLKHWTQDDAAQALGVSRSTIAGYESEQKGRIPRQETLQKIADEFGVTIDYLLGRTDYTGTNVLSPRASRPIEYSDKRANMEIQLSESVENNRSDGTVMVPIVTEIACGQPMYAEDAVQGTYPLNPHLVNIHDGPYVCVKAKGDSMVNARIYDGSLVLIRLQSQVDNGEIAAVCVDNEMATLKRVYFLTDGIRLVPENSNPEYKAVTYSPERIRIVGKALTALSDLSPFK